MKKGFTLPDTLIGITVFLIAASALFGLLNTVIGLSSKAQKSFEATNIAREGIEIVEQMRNTNLIHHLLWNTKETDSFWGTNNFFTSLSPTHPLCFSITPNTSTNNTPWTIKEVPGGCTSIEQISTKNESFIKNLPFQNTSDAPYGRSIMISIKPADLFGIEKQKQTSSSTLHEDDIIHVTSTTWWMEGAQIHSQSLQKILSRWNTTL